MRGMNGCNQIHQRDNGYQVQLRKRKVEVLYLDVLQWIIKKRVYSEANEFCRLYGYSILWFPTITLRDGFIVAKSLGLSLVLSMCYMFGYLVDHKKSKSIIAI